MKFGLLLFIAILLAVSTEGFINEGYTQTSTISKTSPVIAPGARLVKLASGFKFTEGPTSDANGNIYFTDSHSDQIHTWFLDGSTSLFLEKTGGPVGLYFDRDGSLIACARYYHTLISIDRKGTSTVLAEKYNSKPFNDPNDLWIDPEGGIYFTDPHWGRMKMNQDGEHVYYLSPDRNKVIRVIEDMVKPNGVIGTPDGKKLYVSDNGDNKTYTWNINPDGTLSGKKLYVNDGYDGLTIDSEGNVYITGKSVSVYNPAGEKIETIEVPETTSNLCFGGKDNKTLFITARGSLYSIKMRVSGN